MPCDTRPPQAQPTYTFAQAVTHTHTHAYPPPSLPACTALPPESGSQVTFTAIWRRNLFWMTKRVHATRRSCEGMAAREAAARPSSWCGDRSRRTRLVHGFSVPPSDFPHAHGSSLSAPTSLVPQCRRVQDMWSAGMVFRHYGVRHYDGDATMRL